MASDPADLARIRLEVGAALGRFLEGQRAALAAVGPDLLPWIDSVVGLLAGGKRLRPAFCYWGWRAAGGADRAEIYAAAAALELLHASALVHDDVMDASDTRRGRPAVHRQFAVRPEAGADAVTAAAFGAGAAILIGDVLLAWTDEMFHHSGLPAALLRRGQPVLDAMRTEVAAGPVPGPGEPGHREQQRCRARCAWSPTRPPSTRSSGRCTSARRCRRTAAGLPGAPAGHRDSAVARVCTEYGLPLGTAFQLRDDMLGVFGDPAQHRQAGDRRHPRGQAHGAGGAGDGAGVDQPSCRVLQRHLGDRQLTEAAAAKVRGVIAATGALAECEMLISANVKEATSALDGAPIPAEARAALTELAVLATARTE